jgi:hypothetical protein
VRFYIILALRGQLRNASVEVLGGRKPNPFQQLEILVHKNGGAVPIGDRRMPAAIANGGLPVAGWSISIFSKRRILPRM